MSYRIAGIDVHKKMLAVAVADVEVDGDFHFERHKVSTMPADLRGLAVWFVEHEEMLRPRQAMTSVRVGWAGLCDEGGERAEPCLAGTALAQH